ncbi:MAG: TRAP transporter small permease [Chromatiales bacterium]|nr:TRAP transporter small permease [Gammaproteobacteria bacterium]MBW6477363.1 TRAP transporter small permease [Chromatiales bacterium]
MLAIRRVGSLLGRLLGGLDRGIRHAEGVILALGVLLMALNTVANVVGRFVFGESLFFAEEVNRILIVMITFAGIGYAARHGRHIRMSALYDALPKPARRVLMILIALLTALVMLMLSWFSVVYIAGIHGTGRVLPTLNIPVYWIYLWVPIGFTVTGFQYLMTALKNFSAEQVYISTQVEDSYHESNSGV